MKNVVLMEFVHEKDAHCVFETLKEESKHYSVLEATIIKKEGHALTFVDTYHLADYSGIGMIIGGMIGALIGLFVGPFGWLFFGVIGLLIGALCYIYQSTMTALLLKNAGQHIHNEHKLCIVALMNEKHLQTVDQLLQYMEVSVMRYDYDKMIQDVKTTQSIYQAFMYQMCLLLKPKKDTI